MSKVEILKKIDLNADIGEGFPFDAALLKIISSCNIACGGHVGDVVSIKKTMRLAKQAQVSIGAHPAYPDKEGFGRREVNISEGDLKASLSKQLKMFKLCAKEIGVSVSHVKPHGALYNKAAKEIDLALLFVGVVKEVFPQAFVLGPPNSKLEKAARQFEMEYVEEGFADRAYDDQGFLVPRDQPNAVLTSDVDVRRQALRFVLDGGVETTTGEWLPLIMKSICLHGDHEAALLNAQSIYTEFEKNKISIRPPA